MAHQAHNIPWDLLASNLSWCPAGCCLDVAHDLYPRSKPSQGKELTHFARAFAKNIEEHSKCERKKYPAKYDPPKSTDVIIEEKTAAKIEPLLRRWRQSRRKRSYFRTNDLDCDGNVCGHSDDNGGCRCRVLPHEHKIASAFCQPYELQPCYRFLDFHRDGYYNLQVFKTMILYGEIDPILRVCAHPDVALGTWWEVDPCGCGDNTLGWDQVYEKALMAYICLNTIYCFPEIWDKASGKSEIEDYRHSGIYQFVVRTLTARRWGVMAYPHCFFFGIKEDQFNSYEGCSMDEFEIPREGRARWKSLMQRNDGCVAGKHVYGKLPFDDFLALEHPAEHEPGPSDVDIVRSVLCLKGLPVELALDIMELADYTPKHRLNVSRDPLHPSNREELNQYLTFCWLLLVRCDMIAKEVGRKIDWRVAVTRCIETLWDCRVFDCWDAGHRKRKKGMVKMEWVDADHDYTWVFK